MKTIKDLKKMISEPSSKEWFKKHGSAKSNAMHKAMGYGKEVGRTSEGKIILKKPRRLTAEESKEKTKDWPKGSHTVTEADKREHQKKHGRSYDD